MKMTILEQTWQNQETPESNTYAENIMSKNLYTHFLLIIRFHGKTLAVLSKKNKNGNDDHIYNHICSSQGDLTNERSK